ncbi:hypothetical protein [Prochlorococcus sp. MIT 1307]|uniref:hypothetical protein n=1 Tax=Prochlorococcus sp. MIT 1307 TaxID=3096219 RepID=UPI002A7567E8|nr:hypothetical protein [Prochlorococcus sp. MIT 1307]
MASTESLTSQIYSALSDISHPIEGTFYLFLLALLFRWRWPNIWNNFLKKISAPVKNNLEKDSESSLISSSIINEKLESTDCAHQEEESGLNK